MNEQEQQDLYEQFKIKLCHYERFLLCTKSFLTWFSVHVVFPRPCLIQQLIIKLCHYKCFLLYTKWFQTWVSVHIVFPRPCVDIIEPEALKSL